MPLTRSQFKKNSPFRSSVLLERIQIWATMSDLFKLRQLNQTFYSHLTPVYSNLKQLTIEIRIKENLPTGPIKQKWATAIILSGVGKHIDEINEKNWNPKMAQLIKHLFIRNLWFIEEKEFVAYGINFSQIISQISVHVTKLTLEKSQNLKYFKGPNETLTKFIEGFENLKTLHIAQKNKIRQNMENHTIVKLDLEQIEIMLHCTNPITKLIIDIFNLNQFEEIILKFGTNIKLKINLSIMIKSRTEMESLLQISRQYSNFLETFQIRLEFWDDFTAEDLPIIRQSLHELSPILTILKLYQIQNEQMWDVMNHHIPEESHWPKLRELEIEGYDHELKFLRNCTELEKLSLTVSEKCYQKRSESAQGISEEVLEYYFKDMSKLKSLFIWFEMDGEYIDDEQRSKDLKCFLKSLLGEDLDVVC